MAHNTPLQGNKPGDDPAKYGLKFDGGKARWDLIQIKELKEIIAIFNEMDSSFLTVFDSDRIYDEIMSDITDYIIEGNKTDLAYAGFNMFFLLRGKPYTKEELNKCKGMLERWDLIDIDEIQKVVDVYSYGAKKYSSTLCVDTNYILRYLEGELETCQNAQIVKIEKLDINKDNFVDIVMRNSFLVKNLAMNKKKENLMKLGVKRTNQEQNFVSCALKDQLDSKNLNYVDRVMKKGLGKQIQNLPKGKEKIKDDGVKKIQNDLPHGDSEEIPILFVEHEINMEKNSGGLKEEVLLKSQVHYFIQNKRVDAQSVQHFLKLPQKCVWIMTIKQEKREDIYVLAAMSDLEISVTVLKVLQKQLNISTILQLENLQIKNGADRVIINIDGANNWKKVKVDKYKAALLRHFKTVRSKERFDGESGFLHLHHAIWNIITLMWFENQNKK